MERKTEQLELLWNVGAIAVHHPKSLPFPSIATNPLHPQDHRQHNLHTTLQGTLLLSSNVLYLIKILNVSLVRDFRACRTFGYRIKCSLLYHTKLKLLKWMYKVVFSNILFCSWANGNNFYRFDKGWAGPFEGPQVVVLHIQYFICKLYLKESVNTW